MHWCIKKPAYYYIQQQSLELHVSDETLNIVNFVLMSLTELNLQQVMQVSFLKDTLWKVSLLSILVTNINIKPQPMQHVVILTQMYMHMCQSEDVNS